ncbi:MAG: ABC transporter [Porticoccaceae bacterium]|nr:ABC transporter [Porticoccaceae bacterium]
MYRLESVSKSYVRRGEVVTALDNSTFQIDEGEFIAVVGPSGSGKTTLLSILGGMLAPSEGSVFLNETSLYELSSEARAAVRKESIGFVFQTFNLIPWLTALENVQIPLMLAGKSNLEQLEQANAMLDRVGLGERMHHRPGELSQGQQQRVALARTLANNPRVVLADEPTGNLDAATREQVMEYLSEFNREGRTIVMVTHDDAAAAYANRTLRLQDGKVQSWPSESRVAAA